MKKKKVFLITIGVLALLIAAAVFYVFMNMNAVVAAAIEKYGSQATKTDVTVSSVQIQLSSGQGAISGLAVGNPRGFSTRNIFSLGNISARIDVKTIFKSLLVIQEVHISAPEVYYEMNSSGISNLDVLIKNLQGAEGAGKKHRTEKKEKEVRLFIRKLIFENGQVEARIAALGAKPIMLKLPRLELIDIGGNSGATPNEAARAIITALARDTAKVVARSQGEKYLRKGAEGLLKRYLEKQ